jgi:hypothetical protein
MKKPSAIIEGFFERKMVAEEKEGAAASSE